MRSLLAGDSTVYVTLFPGTVPGGSIAKVRVVGRVDTVVTSVVDGGFDPVPIIAGVGDSIEAVVTDAGGAVVKRLGLPVAALRPPVIVRTEPPPRKRDQPLNAALVVVFSEPVSGSSLTASSVQLFRGSTQVAGSVSLLQGTGSAAAFTPDAALSPNTDYRLVVTQAVRDRQGDALAAGLTVPFTTGQSSTGAAASITLSPDTVYLTGTIYQMTATVRDAAGNQLIDQPVTWATSDPSGLTISSTGLLTALAAGNYFVTATLNGLTAYAEVIVAAGPAASVSVAPNPATVGAGDTITLVATVRDAAGRLLYYPQVTWTSSDVAVAAVVADSSRGFGQAYATVTSVGPGSVTITATSGTASGEAAVTVTTRPVASVTVTPASASLVLQAMRQLSATLRDANGKVILSRPTAWTTDNAAVAAVDANGLVTGVSVGSAAMIATSEGVSDTAVITVTVLNFGSVTSGSNNACALTTSGAAYCWGGNAWGQLGDSSTDDGLWPVAITGGLRFTALAAGFAHNCGLTASGAAYCWGYNGYFDGYSTLGDGSTTASSVPVAVTGGLTFSQLSPGRDHTCALTTTGAAYCWGANNLGQLGDGSTTGSSVPVAVTGGRTYVALESGSYDTCGLTASGAAYCWGGNNYGQLGDGSTSYSSVPVAVTGGLTFAALSAGGFEGHTCGLTTTGAAYCWGDNSVGQLGDGTNSSSSVPVAVTGGLTFSAVGAGWYGHSCGLATSGAAYCWGANATGQLGLGTDTGPEQCGSVPCSKRPAAVTGGQTFGGLSVGGLSSCGVTVAGIGYCWGPAYLGNGTKTESNVPVKVAGQQ